MSAKGTELTTHYVDLFMTSEDRKKALKERFGFDCVCRGCEPTPKLRVAFSDARRAHMRQLDEQIYDKASRGKHEAAIRDVTERLIMLEEEELDSPAAVARACDDAAQAAAHANDRKTEKGLERARAESAARAAESSELEELERRLAKLGAAWFVFWSRARAPRPGILEGWPTQAMTQKSAPVAWRHHLLPSAPPPIVNPAPGRLSYLAESRLPWVMTTTPSASYCLFVARSLYPAFHSFHLRSIAEVTKKPGPWVRRPPQGFVACPPRREND